MATKKKEKSPFDIKEAEAELKTLQASLKEVQAEIDRTQAWRKKSVLAQKLCNRMTEILNTIDGLEVQIKEAKKTPKERDLESKFKTAVKDSQKQVDAHLKAAMAELKKAFAVAEKTGIPFNSEICDTYNTYVPNSFKKKWKSKLSEDFWEEMQDDGLVDLGEHQGEYGGWTSSYC